MKYSLYITVFLFLATLLNAQTKTEIEPDPISSFFKKNKIQIRESAFDSNLLSRPAKFQLTSPAGGEESFLADIGILWNLSQYQEEDPWVEYGLLAEFHRNDLSKSEKDSYQAGLRFARSHGDIMTNRWLHRLEGKVVYKRDNVTSSDGTLAEIMYLPYVGRKLGSPFSSPNIGGLFGWSELQVQIQPAVGLQYEKADNVFDSGETGDTLRAKGVFGIAFYPFANSFAKYMSDSEAKETAEAGRVELVFRYTYWLNLTDGGGFSTQPHSYELLTGSLNYFFGSWDEGSKSRPYAIGLDYVKGDNPDEGYKSEEYWQLGFKVKF